MDTFNLEHPRRAGSVGRGAPNRGAPDPGRPYVPLLRQAEYDESVKELDRLYGIRDRDLPDLLREARTFVASDAAEEIIQIRDDQAIIGARIRRLEELLRSALIVEDDVAAQIVSLGRSVQVEYLQTGRVATYRIAGIPASSGSGTVSAASPIGAALMGRSPGDVVAVELPHGRTENLRVLAVMDQTQAA